MQLKCEIERSYLALTCRSCRWKREEARHGSSHQHINRSWRHRASLRRTPGSVF